MRYSFINSVITIGFLILAFGPPIIAWFSGDPHWLLIWIFLLILGLAG